jgi:flagellar hook-associated protein 3 FlgL
MAANEQYKNNIDNALVWQDTTETALASMGDDLKAAHDLIVQGANDTTDPESRKAIALQIDQLIAGLKDSANASIGGVYVLSGTKTDTPPYFDRPVEVRRAADAVLARQFAQPDAGLTLFQDRNNLRFRVPRFPHGLSRADGRV